MISGVRRPAVAVAAVIATVLATGCTSDPRGLPPPSSTSSTTEPPTTTQPDLSGVVLPPVDGTTTTTLATRGRAALAGTVTGPTGAAAGAVVRVERLVAGSVQAVDVPTGPNGAWVLANVPGGRYRIRAFRVPDLLQAEPELLFLPDGQRREFTLTAASFSGRSVDVDTSPGSPVVGGAVNLLVRVVDRRVGPDGIGRAVGVPGEPVQVQVQGYESTGSTAGSTDGEGRAVFPFRCGQVGPAAARVFIGAAGAALDVDVPDCAARPTTTTTTSAPTTTTSAPGGSTTTTTEASTTTTEPDDDEPDEDDEAAVGAG